MSFGHDDIDRYTIVYKKDFAPTEDEILARRNGETWNEEKAQEYAQKVGFIYLFSVMNIFSSDTIDIFA